MTKMKNFQITPPTHDEIAKRAYELSQRKKAAGDKSWNDSFRNWMEAQNGIIHQRRFDYKQLTENWTGGECGN